MIGKLRRKLVLINMALVALMLAVIFGLVYYFTGTALEESAVATLKTAAVSQFQPGRPGSMTQEQSQPCFMLEMMPHGELLVKGSAYFDLTDEKMLTDIYILARADGRETGVLRDYDLRYYHTGGRYVFMDITAQRQTLGDLVESCVIIGIIALGGFLLISIWLARWAVRPVENAWQQQRQFVADASHELKTPLTVILTNAELLQEESYPPEEKQRFADSILTKARQMRQLVESLLELARADNGQAAAVRERLDLSRLVQDAVMEFEPVYFEQGLTLESRIEPGIGALGSTQHLQQVVQILLDNGQKYAEGGTAYVTLNRQGKRSLLTVTTQGQTLTQQQCRDVFKRFYRADAARCSDGSYGLGLSIAQRIVTEHGGKIWAHGQDGRNSFFVSLPDSVFFLDNPL